MTDTATERSEAVDELTTKLREVEHLMVELERDTVDALVDAARARERFESLSHESQERIDAGARS